MQKHTLVIGATPNPDRYAYKATEMLTRYGHTVVAYGIKKGTIGDVEIVNEFPTEDFDTVTLYVGPQNQDGFYKYILNLKPKRVIFNPGTENATFEAQLQQAGIKALQACTLVLLSTGQY
jgi:predicted CoA-binding protein